MAALALFGPQAGIPSVGDFRTTPLGESSVIAARGEPDEVSGIDNRCAHRGVRFATAMQKPALLRQSRIRLRERIVVFKSEMIPNSLIYPA